MIILSFGTVKQILPGYSTAVPHFPITPSPEKTSRNDTAKLYTVACSPDTSHDGRVNSIAGHAILHFFLDHERIACTGESSCQSYPVQQAFYSNHSRHLQ